MRSVFLAVAIGFAVAGLVSADENVRAVQEKLRDGGFYLGQIDGAYSSQLSAALTRYQIRKGLPITGQLDEDTSKALGAKPAVTKNAATPEESSETWRHLRRGERQTIAKTQVREKSSARSEETPEVVAVTNERSRAQPTSIAAPRTATAPPAMMGTRSKKPINGPCRPAGLRATVFGFAMLLSTENLFANKDECNSTCISFNSVPKKTQSAQQCFFPNKQSSWRDLRR